MKTVFATLAFAAMLLMTQLASAELSVGDAAPDFSLPGTDGNTHKLSDYQGKKVVVVAWFPKAFTGG
jgi:peroxiredoxin Q/BCP